MSQNFGKHKDRRRGRWGKKREVVANGRLGQKKTRSRARQTRFEATGKNGAGERKRVPPKRANLTSSRRCSGSRIPETPGMMSKYDKRRKMRCQARGRLRQWRPVLMLILMRRQLHSCQLSNPWEGNQNHCGTVSIGKRVCLATGTEDVHRRHEDHGRPFQLPGVRCCQRFRRVNAIATQRRNLCSGFAP